MAPLRLGIMQVMESEVASAIGPMSDPSEAREHLEGEQRRLATLHESLLEAALRSRSEQEDLSELSASDQHPADNGTETFDRERDLAIVENVEAELEEVRSALERLEAGTYGRCEACGDPIDTERLLALPAARLCLADQRVAEEEARRNRA